MAQDQLTLLLRELRVPPDFSRYENVTDAEIIVQLEEWKIEAYNTLSKLKDILATQRSLPTESTANIIAAVTVFDGNDAWIQDALRDMSRDILCALGPINKNIIECVLSLYVKPLFLSSPHPSLHLKTGRKLQRTAGGSMALQDYYEDQLWKTHAGTGNLVSWCVQHIDSDDYEDLWHLLIPPVMTLLDDFQAIYKLKGVDVVSDMLTSVPKSLLKRTGVASLLLTSLSMTLSHLHDENTPDLIRHTVPVILKLVGRTTTPNSTERFEQHCHLLGENIIGGIWVYASRDSDAIEASFDVLPDVIRALGIGSIRYLKALIPQCLHVITPNPLKPSPASLELAALTALSTVIDQCQPRIHKWKGAIIEGLCKCWVTAVDAGAHHKDAAALKDCLRNIFGRLSTACPSVLQDEYLRLLHADQTMFEPVLGSIANGL